MATAASANPALLKRLQGVLDLEQSLGTDELRDALACAGDVLGPTADASRTALRGALELRAIANANEFLASYDELRKARPHSHSGGLSGPGLGGLEAELRDIGAETAKRLHDSALLLDESRALSRQKEYYEGCIALCEAFAARYRLAPDEARALRGEVSPALLAALERAQSIRSSCGPLVQSAHHRLGLELVDEMSAHVEDAQRRISRWVRAAVAGLAREEPPSADALLRGALAALRGAPDVYRAALEELGAQRGRAVARGFTAALTVGGPGGAPRPIEMHAHDPLRYVGDMLAWVHQAVASEYEFVASLLSPDGAAPARPPRGHQQQAGGEGEGDEERALVMDRAFEGLVKPFALRAQQVLEMRPGAVVLWKLASTLDFYARIVGDLLRAQSPLSAALRECKQRTTEAFYVQLRELVLKHTQSPPVPQPDLTPPQQIKDIAGLVGELLATLNKSLVPAEERRAEFAPALSLVVTPLLDIIATSCSLARLDATSASVFHVNCITCMQAAVAGCEYAAEHVVQLQQRLEAHLETLVGEQAARFMADCGLAQKLALVRNRATVAAEGTPLSQVIGMEPRSVEVAARSFETALLEGGGSLLLPQVERLLSPRHSADVRKRVARTVTAEYDELYAAVTDPAAGYPDSGARLFRYRPAQVAVMLEA
eukprot:m51a1_g4972 Conserved oligomeric Golgi complex subunit 6 (661) ;mRNA; f:10338-12531